ncbi:DPP IV N-terminal domain-containing protein [Nonomuraea sp. NPDC059007]|uniref:S9 family peptidase n=1 Tax=Nonomuraea sp. NPDC059007 TaxID=3346692 RepID=UPI0036A7DFE7
MRQLDVSAYQTAEKLVIQNRHKLVTGDRVRPMWTGDGAEFWYRRGRRFFRVDREERRPAFDHVRLAKGLADASGQDVDPEALPFTVIGLDAEAVEFAAFDGYWRCPLDTYRVEAAQPPAGAGFDEVASPDGRHALFIRDHNLWVRDLADGQERRLSSDGQEDYDYATGPDWWHYSVLIRKLGLPGMPPAAVWSPDGTRVLTHRTDQRGIRRVHLIDALPADGGPSRLYTQRFAYTGDEKVALAEVVVCDVTTGTVVRAEAEALPMSQISPVFQRWMWWAGDGSAYFVGYPRDQRSLSLNRLDPATGRVDTVLTETGTTRVELNQWAEGQAPMVEVLSGGDEVLWYSQRDGWGHLYLYDGRTGALKGQVTSGEWTVREILRIDEAARVVYFTASGLVAGDPYPRSVCRAGLDGSGTAVLTDDGLDHAVTVAPDGSCLVDSASTTEIPPVITLRDWTGRVLVELERADVSGLVGIGWSPPERFRVKAADGVTDVYGVLHKPHGFDPECSYPVIDHPYPGPQRNRVGGAFTEMPFAHEAEVMAALGFVVMALDGRGTPGRDKKFFDHSYGNVGDSADHVAALRELAKTRPWMDLDRVGVAGSSAGAHQAVRAMLDHPEFYKVGISTCGNQDLESYHVGYSEIYQGALGEADYARVNNVTRAERLRGKLLLIHGGMDTNIMPDHTLRLAERLIMLDKDFEMLIVPGAEHLFLGYHHHTYRREWDFLVRHLMGAEPPAYRIAPLPFDPELLSDWF